MVKLVTPFIGGEFVAVEAVFAFSTDNNRLPFKELEADLAAHEALVAGHEGCQVLVEACLLRQMDSSSRWARWRITAAGAS